MQKLSYSLVIFTLCGIWRPLLWSPGWKSMLYNFYTIFMGFLVYTFVSSGFIYLFRSFDNVEEFTNASFMLLTMMSICVKMAKILKERGRIIDLMKVLDSDVCKPRSLEEFKIQQEVDRDSRHNVLAYAALAGSAIMFRTIRSLIVDIPRQVLPFKAWLPFNHDSSEIGFWIAYIHQIIAHAGAACVNIGFDTFVPGLMMQTCAQINILKYRLKEIPKLIEEKKKLLLFSEIELYEKECRILESESVTECVQHHLEIFQFAKTSNDLFGYVVFVQYFMSAVILCASVYELSSMTPLSAPFTELVLYLCCMLTQIFIYCFYSDEMTLQSLEITDAVYEMDWSLFHLRTKKSLVMIMINSQQCISFTCANLITLSLNSFSNLIKLSYSAYNVLQNSGT